MRTLLTSVGLLLLVGLALGFLFGCGGDDDPVDPGGEDECSLILIAPEAASYYLTDDQCNIRWEAEGSAAEVSIELLKNDGIVGDIADTTANDGYYYWSADAMGAGSGEDFAVRVTALGVAGCGDTSGLFTILDTSNCNFVTGEEMADSTYVAGTLLELDWTSHHTTGSVDLELWHGHLNEYYVGLIGAETPDDGYFSWPVDSFHDAAHRDNIDPNFYWIKIVDSNLSTCYGATPFFGIFDEDICTVDVLLSPGLPIQHIGETLYIEANIYNGSDANTVNFRLYAGNEFVPGGYIQNDWPLNIGSYAWTVTDYGFTGGGSLFNIRAIDSGDGYCWGKTGFFSIVE